MSLPSATTALALIIIGQLAMWIVIDQFGLFGAAIRHIDAWRVAGVLLLMAGGYLMIR
jgi:transporter family-2 protein